jgi:hypothetical protein
LLLPMCQLSFVFYLPFFSYICGVYHE